MTAALAEQKIEDLIDRDVILRAAKATAAAEKKRNAASELLDVALQNASSSHSALSNLVAAAAAGQMVTDNEIAAANAAPESAAATVIFRRAVLEVLDKDLKKVRAEGANAHTLAYGPVLAQIARKNILAIQSQDRAARDQSLAQFRALPQGVVTRGMDVPDLYYPPEKAVAAWLDFGTRQGVHLYLGA